jgi:hypothetical protein
MKPTVGILNCIVGEDEGRDVQKLTPWNCFLPQKLTGPQEV